jgi:hypothetical protein
LPLEQLRRLHRIWQRTPLVLRTQYRLALPVARTSIGTGDED